jgi:hypothetical protein
LTYGAPLDRARVTVRVLKSVFVKWIVLSAAESVELEPEPAEVIPKLIELEPESGELEP